MFGVYNIVLELLQNKIERAGALLINTTYLSHRLHNTDLTLAMLHVAHSFISTAKSATADKMDDFS